MSDWYVSSAAYAGIAAFAASTAYTVGQLIKPTAPTITTSWVLRCTTAGTTAASEPVWQTANNATTTSGTAVFTNVTGQSAYGWSAAAGTYGSIVPATNQRALAGDRVFLSSDHSETSTAAVTYGCNGNVAAYGVIQVLSVNRAGSVPPVAADIQSGAALTISIASGTGAINLDAYCNLFWQGITFTMAGASASNQTFNFNSVSAAKKAHYLKNCAIVITNTAAGDRITAGSLSVAKVTFDNTTVQFGNAAQAISNAAPFDFNWINTPSAIQGATIPTTLFSVTTSPAFSAICRGVDLSAVTGTLFSATGGTLKGLLDSCKIASAVTRLATPSGTTVNAGDEVELVNCYDGTNVLNERYTAAGAVTTDRSTYMSNGAQDDVGSYALKLVSNTRADFQTMPLDAFWLDVENTATGASKTATIEVASPVSLLSTDIRLMLEYMDTAGSSIADIVENLASVLTTGSALSSSSNTWTAPAQYSAFNSADASALTFSNNNLTVTASSTQGGARGVNGFYSGKFYWEITAVTVSAANTSIGIALSAAAFTAGVSANASTAGVLRSTGVIYVASVSQAVNIGAVVSGDVIGVALDTTTNLIWIRKAPSGNWNASGSANPATGVGGFSVSSLAASGRLFPFVQYNASGETFTANFGASAFTGSVPSGFTSGLPLTPTAKQRLQVAFTPQQAGRVRGLVRTSAIQPVWVNPQIAIT